MSPLLRRRAKPSANLADELMNTATIKARAELLVDQLQKTVTEMKELMKEDWGEFGERPVPPPDQPA